MKTLLLNSAVQQYIQEHLDTDIKTLAFKKSPFEGIEMIDLLTQVESKQKSKTKLPTWFKTDNILFPKKLSIEQTSSEVCASYKASLISGKNLIDLTGGFGIDCYYFAKNFITVTHCEMQEELSEIVKHNYTLLDAKNINTYCGDSIEYLANSNTKWDWIYIDPARRNQAKEKVFFLSDCVPNVPENLATLFNFSDNILIKTSPLLDIHAGIAELKYVKAIHIVALNNEVKELLWILEKGFEGETLLIAANINKGNISKYKISLNEQCSPTYSAPQTYLYEPNNAVLKTGKFDCIGAYYSVNKLHQHSQIYTSVEVVDFPGRTFKILDIFEYNKTNAKNALLNIKANVTTRNFPLKVEELRKKWKIKDGGDIYIFFTTNISNQKIFIFCEKIDKD